ncbi:MAG: LysR family glycine cleavage system transcriptional activator [Kiritimatiellia bacterium]|jgi:LysR family glycine cleavage system transcriptional activator
MDLLDLRCFLAATDASTFRAAAKRVHLSPGAFSDRIRRLEEDLGTTLFHRTSRSIRLAEAGHRLRPHARALLANADKCRTVVSDNDSPLPYEMTLGTRYELGISWICPALPHLLQAHPERTLHLYMADAPDLLGRVESGAIDAVIFSTRLTSPRLRYVTLHTESYVFVGAPGTVMNSLDDCAKHTLIDVAADLPLFRYLVDAMPGGRPWAFHRHWYLGGIGGMRALIVQGQGVGVLPMYFVKDDIDNGRLVRLLPDQVLLGDNFRLVWRQNHPFEYRLQGLAEELQAIPLR